MPAFSAIAPHHILYAAAEGLDLDAEVLRSVQEESFLLVENCSPSVDQRPPEFRAGPDGVNFLAAYDPGMLLWSVQARVLRWDGLADYRPGAALTRQSLEFANGPDYRLPFQFSDDGVLVYERPVPRNAGGTLPAISFEIRQVCGGGYDTTAYPAAAVPMVSLPTQISSTELHTDGRHALLLDAFNSTDEFADEDLLITLYAGDPLGSGTGIVQGTSAAWTDLSEPDLAYRTTARNPVINLTDTSLTEKTATHYLLTRNGITIAAPELENPLIIPAGHGVRIPENALAVHLTWPLDGTPLPDAEDRPARLMITLALGAPRASVFPNGNRYLTFQDSDFTTPTEYDAIPAVAATSTYFTVSGLTVTPTGITSPNLAPPGGWPITAIKFRLNGADTVLLRKYHTLTVAEGVAPALSGAPVLNLAAAPAP